MYCAHWFDELDYSDNGDWRQETLERVGKCRLNPQEIETAAVYSCGHLTLAQGAHNHIGTLPILARFRQFMDEQTDKIRDLKAEVKRLKAANTKLRSDMKRVKE